MRELIPFCLEDFFCEYEHRGGLINLASSDALPWTLEEMKSACPELNELLDKLSFQYPNVKDTSGSALRKFCEISDEAIDVLPTTGAEEAIFLALQEIRLASEACFSVAVPDPGYGAFGGICKLLGFEVRPYQYRSNCEWQIAPQQIVKLAEECDVIIVNNPHNPTGRVMDEEVLKKIAGVVDSRGSTLMVDEVFRLPDEVPSSLGLGQHVIVIGSLSKVYGFPGLRFGWVVGPKDRIHRMRTIQQYLTLSLNSFAAGVGAIVLNSIQNFSRLTLLQENRRIVKAWASANREVVKLTPPEAGTTVILEILKPVDEGIAFNGFLARGVLLVPGGRCFGCRDSIWFRLGYGADTEKLQQGLAKIVEAIQEA